MEEKDLVKIEYVIPKEFQGKLAEKINEGVVNSYYGNVGSAVTQKVQEMLNEEGIVDEIATSVVEQIKMSKEDFIDGLQRQVIDSLMNVTSVIATETLDKISEKVKSYGFIKIADRY
jgi:NADPH-dependent curcumin reductase CurA